MQGAWARRGVGLQEANAPNSPLGDFNSTGQPYPTVFNTGVSTTQDRSAVQGRPAGVIDPADRVLPWRPEADKARREFIPKMIPPASLAYIEKSARCVLPGPLEADDRHPYQIIQRPGSFVMMYEYNHVTRVIPTDGRPHVGPNIRLFMGDSVGHWEGETLVVDTTNFNDKTSLGRTVPYHSDALHTVERFTQDRSQHPGLSDHDRGSEDVHATDQDRRHVSGRSREHRTDGVCLRRRQPDAAECIRVRVRARPCAGQPVMDLHAETGVEQ